MENRVWNMEKPSSISYHAVLHSMLHSRMYKSSVTTEYRHDRSSSFYVPVTYQASSKVGVVDLN